MCKNEKSYKARESFCVFFFFRKGLCSTAAPSQLSVPLLRTVCLPDAAAAAQPGPRGAQWLNLRFPLLAAALDSCGVDAPLQLLYFHLRKEGDVFTPRQIMTLGKGGLPPPPARRTKSVASS